MRREHRVPSTPPRQYKPEECLTWAEALYIYTLGGAYACRREHLLGSILPGRLGDMVLLYSRPGEEPGMLDGSGGVRPDRLPQFVYNAGDCNPELLTIVGGTLVTAVNPARVEVTGPAVGVGVGAALGDSVPPSAAPVSVFGGLDGKNGHWEATAHAGSSGTGSGSGELYCSAVGGRRRAGHPHPPLSWSGGDSAPTAACRCCLLREFLR